MAFEVRRRIVHASGAIIPGSYLIDQHILESGFITWQLIQLLAVAGLFVTILLEAGRLSRRLNLAIYNQLTREYEQESIAGYALYVFSGTVVILVFAPRVAIPALFMLTIADPVSGILSSGELRRIKRPRVLVGMFVVSFMLAFPFVSAVAAAAGALGSTVADGVKPVIAGHVVDDNLTIPVVAALAMWLVLTVS